MLMYYKFLVIHPMKINELRFICQSDANELISREEQKKNPQLNVNESVQNFLKTTNSIWIEKLE